MRMHVGDADGCSRMEQRRGDTTEKDKEKVQYRDPRTTGHRSVEVITSTNDRWGVGTTPGQSKRATKPALLKHSVALQRSQNSCNLAVLSHKV